MIKLPKSMEEVEANREFKLAPAGTYELEIVKAKEGISKNDNTKIDFQCKIINDEEYTGVVVFECCTITEEALFRLKQLSLATGVEIDDEFSAEEFVGATFEAVLNVTTYKDNNGVAKEKNEISQYIFEE
jgi:hypothetical protein